MSHQYHLAIVLYLVRFNFLSKEKKYFISSNVSLVALKPDLGNIITEFNGFRGSVD